MLDALTVATDVLSKAKVGLPKRRAGLGIKATPNAAVLTPSALATRNTSVALRLLYVSDLQSDDVDCEADPDEDAFLEQVRAGGATKEGSGRRGERAAERRGSEAVC